MSSSPQTDKLDNLERKLHEAGFEADREFTLWKVSGGPRLFLLLICLRCKFVSDVM